MNNKGMSLVEVVITFSVLFIIIIGLYNLILDVKTTLNEKEIIKNITDFSSNKVNEIEYNLITHKPFAVIIKENTKDNFKCASKKYCNIKENSISINYDNKIRQIGIGSLTKDYCNNIYPCAIYFYKDKSDISAMTIALNVDKNSKLDFGILYGKEKDKTYEKVPNVKDIVINTSSKYKDKNVYLAYNNNLLIINFPYYLKDSNDNYGFKIAYPMKEE